MKGIIVGAGIAGLTASIALQKIGIETLVCEAAPQIKSVGAGIWMATNAMQVFGRLGFGQAIIDAGIPLNRVEVTDARLKKIQSMNMQRAIDKFGYSITAIHRAKLQQILIEQLADPSSLRLGKRVKQVCEKEQKIIVNFEDGSQLESDFLIGADGIHSAVRRSVFGAHPLRYSGQTCWRGLADFSLPEGFQNSTIEAWAGAVRLGFAAIAKEQVYWFAVAKMAAGGIDEPKQLKASLQEQFKHFAQPIPQLLSATPVQNIIRSDLYDFLPLPHWHKGRVCLIGDAAHAVTPNMGQGGGQAVEDAYFLAKMFDKYKNVDFPTIFKAFQQKRYKKVNGILKNSYRIGQIAHLNKGQGLRNFLFRLMPERLSYKAIDAVYNIDY